MPIVQQKTLDNLHARIAALETEVTRLLPFADRYREDGKRKRTREKEQRNLLHSFFHYKNFAHADKRPDVLCVQCSHCSIKPGTFKKPNGQPQVKYRCKLSGAYCSKFGSCDGAVAKPHYGLRERV